MLSRVAESLYWLGRNVERAETIARILDVSYTRAMDLYTRDDGRYEQLWRSVMRAAGFVAQPKMGTPDRVAHETLAHCIFDHGNPNSIVSSVRIARTNALGIRAELTTELWEVVNVFYLYAEGQSLRTAMREGPARFLKSIREAMQSFAGVADATLSHGDAWCFLRTGRFLERAYMTARMLDASDVEREAWQESQRLLEMCCASEPFIHDSHDAPEPRDAIAYIVLAPECPRSRRFALREIDLALHGISHTPEGTFANAAERRVGRMRALFDFASRDELFGSGVHGLAQGMLDGLLELSTDIETAYFPRMPVGAA
jgi:uncharacterized alpha-E superfamily protein